MTARPYLRTHDLALAGDISVQQVRNYEANGLIPQAQRSPSDYRLYTQQHLTALKTVKSMVRGYGWPRTSAIMQALHRGDLSAALAIIDERHAEHARKRLQMEQTLSALRLFAAGVRLAVSHLPSSTGCEWVRRPNRWAYVSPPCISGNSKACCTQFASSTATTVSTTSTRCAACASWPCSETLAIPSTSSSQCSTNWRRVGLKKLSWLWRKGARNSRGQAGHVLKP